LIFLILAIFIIEFFYPIKLKVTKNFTPIVSSVLKIVVRIHHNNLSISGDFVQLR